MAENHSVSETPIRVRYAETDAMGVVHHSSYIVWFEAGRSDYIRQRGSSYADFEKAGYRLVVSELDARFAVPAVYDELVVVRTWVEELKSRKLVFGYAVVRPATGETLCTGHTCHICTDHQGQVTAIPHRVRSMLAGGEL
jgi:acyl-CoA thioester hydrolase